MNRVLGIVLVSLLATNLNLAFATKQPSETSFQEDVTSRRKNAYYEKLKGTRTQAEEEQIKKNAEEAQSARETYLKFHNRARVPGFISASPIPQIARIVGPTQNTDSLRMGDTLYLRWAGAPLPRPGDRYSTFTPAIVLQNMLNPSDFEVTRKPERLNVNKLEKDWRLAGYFYESTGRVKVLRVKSGLVEAVLEQLSGQVMVGDELMTTPPLVENITKIESGLQLSAAVVCGSPFDRLSTTERSFIYINRGARDGIRVGRILESIENIKLDQAVAGAAPERSNGQAVVIYTTDSYSTAMIITQFDVIRVGSLLRTSQESAPLEGTAPFQGYKERAEAPKRETLPEVPNLENNPDISTPDTTLPEPGRASEAPPLSELDALEKSAKTKALSAEEKTRLSKLSRQEKLDAEQAEEEGADALPSPTVGSSFKDKKPPKKEARKKKATKNEEEELNLLMMQN